MNKSTYAITGLTENEVGIIELALRDLFEKIRTEDVGPGPFSIRETKLWFERMENVRALHFDLFPARNI